MLPGDVSRGRTHGHQVGRVAADGVELQTRLPHEVGEVIMRRETHAMAVPSQGRAVRNEGLDIACVLLMSADDISTKRTLPNEVSPRATMTYLDFRPRV